LNAPVWKQTGALSFLLRWRPGEDREYCRNRHNKDVFRPIWGAITGNAAPHLHQKTNRTFMQIA
jgi:hypothetical protein